MLKDITSKIAANSDIVEGAKDRFRRGIDEVADMDLSKLDDEIRDRIGSALAVLAAGGFGLGTLQDLFGNSSRRGVEIVEASLDRSGRLVREHPRGVGIGLGTVAVGAAGAYLFYRMMKAKSETEESGQESGEWHDEYEAGTDGALNAPELDEPADTLPA